MLTGLTPGTFKKLQTDAGLMLKNFDYSDIKTAAALADAIANAIGGEHWIGATRGGTNFEATPETREVEADGMRSAFVGSTINDKWLIKLTSTLIEMTADNLKLALGAVDAVKSGDVTKLTLRSNYKEDDYIDSVVWIGEVADGGYVLIDIQNALAVGGLKMSFKDKGEGEIPIELTAHQASVDNQGTAPVTILLFDAAA